MKIAGVQMNVVLGDPQQNMDRMIGFLRQARENGTHLTVFPECALTGYCFESLDEARPFAEPVSGPAIARMHKTCAELGCWAVFGMIEADEGRLFNAAVLVGPNGLAGVYRKVHLPFLGVDMFTTYGDKPFAVHEAGELRVGMNICYDSAFPEAARSLTLLGADLIALPTNWPGGAECTASCCVNARALENGVYYIAVNRGDSERGFQFIGRSIIADPYGHTLAVAPREGEAVFYADIDLDRTRRKHYVRVPGKHEIDRLADRRPEMYSLLTQPHNLKRPGR